ncbi:MAG: aldehyde dehydrogenase family protein [Nocardia sp.]|nr:aldehyde dehydrogenase family protein [Nocardia sp.]
MERVYVRTHVYDTFLTELLERARELRTGPGTAKIGPTTVPKQLAVIHRHIGDTLGRGGRALLGGVGASGFGRVHGPDGLREFTYAKATTRQRFSSPLALTTFTRSAGIDTVVDRLVSVLHGRIG